MMTLVEPVRRPSTDTRPLTGAVPHGSGATIPPEQAIAAAVSDVQALAPDRADLVQRIADIVAQAVGTGCMIRPRSPSGRWIETGWISHADPGIAADLLALTGRSPQAATQGICGQVVTSGEPFYAQSLAEMVAATGIGEDTPFHPAFGEGYTLLGQSSIIVAPIVADPLAANEAAAGDGGASPRVVGILAVTRDLPLPPFTLDEVVVVQDLIDQIGGHLRHGIVVARLRAIEARCREHVGQVAGIAYVRGVEPGVPSADQVALVSPQVWPLLGYTQAEWSADPALWAASLHPEDRERVLAEATESDASGLPFRSEYRMTTRDRRVIWIRDDASLLRDETGTPVSWCGVMTDLSASDAQTTPPESETIRISEQRLLALVRHATDAICILAKDGTVTWASPSVERVLGWSPAEIIGRSVLTPHPEDISLAGETLARALLEPDQPVTVELRFQDHSDQWRWVEAIHTNLLADPTVAGIVVNFHDISDRKAAEHRLRWQAYHDALTNLPNRAAFSEKLDALLAGRAPSIDGAIAVLLMDLDQFKRVNDGLGHAAGDLLLQQVAARFTTVLREGEFLARFGGDEFVAIVEMRYSQPEVAAERLIAALGDPFDLHGTEVRIDSSVGIARSSSVSTTAGDLLREADVALYQAKAGGRGRAANFDAAMGVEVLTRLGLESDLRHAVERDELRLRFQPVIALASGALVGFEALVRWEHPVRGLVAPAEFLSLAEESGQITSIGEWVLANALAEAAQWPHGPVGRATPPSAPGGLAGFPGYAARDSDPAKSLSHGSPGALPPGEPGAASDQPGTGTSAGAESNPIGDGADHAWQAGQAGQDPYRYGPYGAYPPAPPYPPYPAYPGAQPHGYHGAPPYPSYPTYPGYPGYPGYPPYSPYPNPGYAPPPPAPFSAYPGVPPPPGHPGYPGFPPYSGYPSYPSYPGYPGNPPHARASHYVPSYAAMGQQAQGDAPTGYPTGAPVVMVNLSARQLRQPGLAAMVSGLLRAHRMAPERLVLEVSGHTILEAGGITSETLHTLKATGVMLAIDDFGIEASALSLVRRLPFDGLKVDRSFVREMAMDWPSLSIVRTFVSLAHDLGLRVTAEGIETAEELGRLREMGCDFGQGYFLAPPLEPEEVLEYIRWVQR